MERNDPRPAQAAIHDDRSMKILEIILAMAAFATVLLLAGVR